MALGAAGLLELKSVSRIHLETNVYVQVNVRTYIYISLQNKKQLKQIHPTQLSRVVVHDTQKRSLRWLWLSMVKERPPGLAQYACPTRGWIFVN